MYFQTLLPVCCPDLFGRSGISTDKCQILALVRQAVRSDVRIRLDPKKSIVIDLIVCHRAVVRAIVVLVSYQASSGEMNVKQIERSAIAAPHKSDLMQLDTQSPVKLYNSRWKILTYRL